MYVLNDFLKITLSHFRRTETTNEVISTPNCSGFILYALFILFFYQDRIKGTEKASPIHTLFHR